MTVFLWISQEETPTIENIGHKISDSPVENGAATTQPSYNLLACGVEEGTCSGY